MNLAVSEGWGELEQAATVESFCWLHVPEDADLLVAVLSNAPVVYRGHYIAGAVQPCSIPICQRCRSGVGVQKRVVLSVFDMRLGLRGLVELGEQSGGVVHRLARDQGELRGLTLLLSKEGQRQRGRILVDAYGGPLVVDELPAAQDPLIVLNAQWARLAMKQRAKDGPGGGQVSLRGEEAAPVNSDLTSNSGGLVRLKRAVEEAERKANSK